MAGRSGTNGSRAASPSLPETMRAAFITATGDVDAITVGRLPVPRPGPTDLLVRMAVTTVNHVDLFVRSGAYPTHTPFPFVIGRDLVGTVVRAGDGVDRFRIGDRVWCNSLGHHGRQGTFAEYAVVPADRAYPLPDAVEPADAIPVLHAAATAYLGLFREARLAPGETAVVLGASGAVGSAVVQLAAAAGARVVATCGAGEADWCHSCGAVAAVDGHPDDESDRIRAATPGGADVWFDTTGRNELAGAVPLLSRGARVLIMSGMQGADPALPVGALYTNDVSLHGFAISNASVTDLADAARMINALLESGRLRGRIGATYRLADARRAHADMEHHRVRGRILLVP